MKFIKNVIGPIFGVVILLIFIYGMFKLDKWWNYKISYQGKVQEEMQPLVDRIDALEKRVELLE